MQVPAPTGDRYRLSRAEYDRALEAGVFAPEVRLELIDGCWSWRCRTTPCTATARRSSVCHARCGILEYWVLALPDAHLEVYRDPRAGVYATVTTHGAGERVAPLARLGAAIAVNDLLP